MNRGTQAIGITLGATVIALSIAKAPVLDVEISARMDAENAALAKPQPEPCWDELPFRKAITQENIDRLCIKVQPPRPVASNRL